MERLTIKELAPYLPYDLKGVDYFQGHRLIRDITLHNVMAIVDGDTKLKPLLRPLSSLTEEIEHNGESFVPTIEWTWGRFEEISTLKQSTLRFIQLREYEILIEHHFDVFGLIGRGLALPIDGKEVEGDIK